MAEDDRAAIEEPQLGWNDLGRYFIFHSTTSIVFTAIFWLGVYASQSQPDLGYWLPALALMPISLALYLTLKPRGRVAWRLLGFRQTQYYWYVTSICGWIGLVVLICLGLTEIGKAVSAPEILYGRLSDGPVRGFGWSFVVLLLIKLTIILPVEIVFRGLVLHALRNLWSFKGAVWVCALLSIGSITYFTIGIGFVPACAIVFLGGLFNGWLVLRSGSIWPGLISLTGFVSFYVFYLERMPA